jgi:antitoxin component of MazEF toxin-antitoxin module
MGDAAVIKNLVRHGNSWALVIDRPILELLKIRPEDPVEITTDGSTVTISPVPATDRKARVAAARAKVNARHKKAFEKLAE